VLAVPCQPKPSNGITALWPGASQQPLRERTPSPSPSPHPTPAPQGRKRAREAAGVSTVSGGVAQAAAQAAAAGGSKGKQYEDFYRFQQRDKRRNGGCLFNFFGALRGHLVSRVPGLHAGQGSWAARVVRLWRRAEPARLPSGLQGRGSPAALFCCPCSAWLILPPTPFTNHQQTHPYPTNHLPRSR
jgi:hypothetical protein